MNIRFLRHFPLEWRFADYNKLTFQELRQLGMYRDHHINSPVTNIPSINVDTPCFTSFQPRTLETAEMIGLRSIKQMDCLRELYFDLSLLMTEEEYKLWWLQSVRNALWQWFFSRKNGVESPELVMNRIEVFYSEIMNFSGENIVVISHWFFLQLLKCFLEYENDFRNMSHGDFIGLWIKPIVYWEWFEITLQK